MSLGSKIQILRKNKGMSQEDLSNLLNVSRQAVQKWENDTSVPEIDKIVQISNIFNVSLDYLLKDNTPEEKPVEEQRVDSKEEKVSRVVTYEENGMDEGRIRACRVWLIIGAVLTPLSAGGSFLGSVQSPFALLFLLLYAITIPLCCLAINAIKTAKNKNEVIGWGVVSLLFVSFIGGILILSARFKTKQVESSSSGESSVVHSVSNSEPQSSMTLEETKYASLQQFIYDYETTGKTNSLREIVTISTFLAERKYKDADSIKQKYAPLLDKKEKETNAKVNKGLKIGGIIALVVIVLTAIIVPVSITSANNAKKKHLDEVYAQVIQLLDDYDDSNYYEIQSLMNELYGGDYDTSALWKKLNGRHNYEVTVNKIKLFSSGKSYKLSDIKGYMNSAEDGYKKIEDIRRDYANVDNYVSSTSSNTSTSAPKYATDGTAETNRNAISYLYKYSNTSGLWNFDYYVKYFSIPYLISGAEFSSGSYNFKWYHESSGAYLTWAVPTISAYDSSISYYFETSFTGSGYKSYSNSSEERYSNQMKFYLKPKSGSSSNVDLFRIDEVGYQKSSDKFYCRVYLFANGQTVTFTQN